MVGSKRRWFTAAFGNVLLLAILIGLPFARGVSRAKQTWPRYARAAACMLGGAPAQQPGLGAVPAIDARFGAQVIHAWSKADAQWVARCDALLAAIPPEPAIFVWPPAKEGELRLREAVRVARAELDKLRSYQGDARVPHDPVRALQQLRRELEGHAERAGIIDIPPQAAVVFPRGALARPSKAPIYAGADASLSLWGNDDALHVVAVDRTGVSYLRAQSDEIHDSVRHVRPALLEDFARSSGQSYLLWALAREKCKARSGGCEGKSMGISEVEMPLTKLRAPRWLASHPSGRLDRSVLRAGDAGLWLMFAEGPLHTTELRGFMLSERPGGDVETELAPLRWSFSDKVTGEPLALLRLAGASLALSAVSRDDGTSFVARELADTDLTSAAMSERTLASVSSHDAAWAAPCSDGQRARVAMGTASELLVVALGGAEPQTWEPLPLALGNVIHERDPVRDRVKTLCVPAGSVSFARDDNDELWAIHCADGEPRCARARVAEHVTSFAALDAGHALLLAFAGSEQRAQIRVQRFDYAGKALDEPRLPSACWDPRGGMCDQPRLHKLGARVLLSARDQTDLLVLESPDEGASWREAGGFPVPFD